MSVAGRVLWCLAGLVLVASCKEQTAEAPGVVRPVRAMQVGDTEAVSSRWFPGRAAATQEADLAFEVAGRLVERPVNVGDRISRGQLLAALDPRDFENDLEGAQGERDRAMSQRDRIKQAAASGAVSQQDLTNAEADLRIAEAEVRIRQKAFEDSRLSAPFDGVVAAIFVENFENVRAKETVLRVLDTSRIEMTVDLPETAITMVPYVEDVRVRFDVMPDREFPATIKEVGSEASRETRTYPVTLVMDQPDEVKIMPGMAGQATGRVELPADIQQTGFEVPLDALFTDPAGGTYVWVLEPSSGALAKREVQRGRIAPIGVVVTGVEAGEWIVTAGVHSVSEDQQVRILGQDQPQG